MCIRKKHSVNGEFKGMFYETEEGNHIYMAHRTNREIYKKRKAWMFDLRFLEDARLKGVKAVGVVVRSGKTRKFYLTFLEDFFTSIHSFEVFGQTKQRGIPTVRFKINPENSEKSINSAIKMR
jgi:hypothetical protein